VVGLAAGGRGAPPIHDISTDVDDPPVFEAAATLEANRARDLSYPNGAVDTPQRQRAAYPDVRSIATPMSRQDAFAAALVAAEDLGWTVTTRDATAGTFEATDETSIFRFVDDVAVRVRARDAGSVIDVRSLSRVGVGDMGVNARRIRAFREALLQSR
jgi:hypothetical protein